MCIRDRSIPVRVGPVDLGRVDVLANTSPVQGADGYMGIGVLRAFDMWFEHGRVGLRPSGLSVRDIGRASAGACESGSVPSVCS